MPEPTTLARLSAAVMKLAALAAFLGALASAFGGAPDRRPGWSLAAAVWFAVLLYRERGEG